MPRQHNKNAITKLKKLILSGKEFTIPQVAKALNYTPRGARNLVNFLTKELKIRSKMKAHKEYTGPKKVPVQVYRYGDWVKAEGGL